MSGPGDADATLHDALACEPESVPAEQVRVSDTHVLPDATEASLYAVTLAPLAKVCPLKVQDATDCTMQEVFWYVPESAPFVHVRLSDVHWLP